MNIFYAVKILNRAAKQYPDRENELYRLKQHALFFLQVFEREYMLRPILHEKEDQSLYLYIQFDYYDGFLYGFHIPVDAGSFLDYVDNIPPIRQWKEFPNTTAKPISMELLNKACDTVRSYLAEVINGKYGITFFHPNDYCDFSVQKLLEKWNQNQMRLYD